VVLLLPRTRKYGSHKTHSVPLKTQTQLPHMNPFTCKITVSGNVEFLQPYPVAAADWQFAVGTAVISTILSLDEQLSQTDTSCVQTFCFQSVYYYLVCYFLVRIFIAQCSTSSISYSKVNTRSAREYTILASAQLLCNWREQRPSNWGDLDSNVTRRLWQSVARGCTCLI
jgi:hypothetical protein